MRILLLTRGAPGAGKSTWIEKQGLKDYALAPDDLRMLCSSEEWQPDGSFRITREADTETKTWSVLFELLEYRMARGDLTVVDATCSKTKDMKQYLDLAEKYRYRVVVVDFTDVPLETCLERNKMRAERKIVPEDAIKNIYSRFAAQKIPSGVKTIKPYEFDLLLDKPVDVSSYRKLVFVGDVHGCYDTLMRYPDFKDGLKDDVEYVFLGDYVDRGNQNAETLAFLSSIMDKPNVFLLEGNHERHIRDYGLGMAPKTKDFQKTQKELEAAGFGRKEARAFYRKLRQFSHLAYYGLEILACHGGVPNLSKNLLYVPTSKLVKGVGRYSDYVENAESWTAQTSDNCYLVHGHRNTEGSEAQLTDRVFVLEGRVEFGGSLRIAECEFDGERPVWKTVELKSVQPIMEEASAGDEKIETVGEAIAYLRKNKFVNEKDLGNGISSFNFTREAFYEGNWNHQTVLARGLFLDTENEEILARSYEKFFRIGEVPETELAALRERFAFPVRAYLKENGFLGIVSYNYRKDDLFIASKSTDKGDFAGYLRKAAGPYLQRILGYFRKRKEAGLERVSLVFECIDPENDPHIIEYPEGKLVLLDAVKNKLDYEALDYGTLKEIAEEIGTPVKEEAFVFGDFDELLRLYKETQDEGFKYKGKPVEGFVFVDSLGQRTKCKTAYYNEWKKLRGVSERTLRYGYLSKTGMLVTPLENDFYAYCRKLYRESFDRETKSYPFKTDVISLRNAFFRESEQASLKLN